MNKFFSNLFVISLLFVFASAFSFSWDYTETFTNNNAPASSYANGSFTGDNGFVWNYIGGRQESGYGINGKGLMLRTDDAANDPKFSSQTLAGGITDFRVYLKKAFTGSGQRKAALYINGEFIANSEPFDDTQVHLFEVKDINIPGNVVIELRNLGPQIVFDDLSWTIYGKPGDGVPTRVSIVKLMPEKPMANVPFKAIVQLIDDEGIPQKLTTNTAINLELRSGTGTLNGVLTGIIPAGQTTVVFENLIYSNDDIVTLRSGAPNNKTGNDKFLRDLETIIDFAKQPVLSVDVYPYGHAGAYHPNMTAVALGEYGLPNTDFNGYNATININYGGTLATTLTVKFERGIATFKSVVLSNTGNYSASVTADYIGSSFGHNINVLPMPVMTDVIIPDYIKGDGSFLPQGNGRMPSYALVRFDNLHPGIEYRFLSGSAEVVPSTKPVTPGNMVAFDPYNNTYSYPATKDLALPGSYGAFVSDYGYKGETTTGYAYVWLSMVPTSNAEFTTGKYVNWCVDLGTSRGSQIARLYTTEKSKNLTFSTNCNPPSETAQNMQYATGLFDPMSPAAAKNYLVFYDKNGNPVTTALVQENGSVLQTPGFLHQCPWFYANYESSNGAFATFLPNNLTGGIQSVVEYNSKGQFINQWNDMDGNWAGFSTSNCGLGMFPPDGYNPENNNIPFQLPQISLMYPQPYEEVCNTEEPYYIYWLSRGINTLNIWISKDNGEWELLENNVDARKLMYGWDIPRGRYTDADLKLFFEIPDYPELNFESNTFRIYDAPVVSGSTPSMAYCVGEDVNLLVEAEGSNLTYQWFKDGKPVKNGGNISGANEAVLNINNIRHYDGGTFTAVVYGHNNCPTATTQKISVYPARPLSFVLPVKDITIGEVVGNTALLSFKVNVNGIEIGHEEFERYDVKVQWYKKLSETNDVKLTDNDKYAGTKSDWLTIRNFQVADAGIYFAEVTGLCGEKVKSPRMTLVEVDIKIQEQPQNNTVCQDRNVEFNVKAASSSNEIIIYQWFKGTTPLANDGRITGADSPTLKINNVTKADEGSYYAKATLAASKKSASSTNAQLKVNLLPTITQQPEATKTLISGSQLSLEVVAEGNYELEELTYQWFVGDAAIAEQTEPTLIIDGAMPENSGTYYCMITNGCGTVKSENSVVTITTTTTDVTEVTNNGYSLSAVQPNPVTESAMISYFVPQSSTGTIKLIDAAGNELSTLVDGNLAAGSNKLEINIHELNISSGVYYYVLQTSNTRLIQRMIVIK